MVQLPQAAYSRHSHIRGMTDLAASANRYALAAIRERRAELAGEITQLESRLRHPRESLVHVDGTLRLFDTDADPSTIPLKRPYKRVKLFGASKNRMVLDALRKGGRPMKTGEGVNIVTELGFGPEAAAGLKSRVRAKLVYLAKVRGLVIKDGERDGRGGGCVLLFDI